VGSPIFPSGYGYAFSPPAFFANERFIAIPRDSVSSISADALLLELRRTDDGAVEIASVVSMPSDRFGFGEMKGSSNGLIVSAGGQLSEIDLRLWSTSPLSEIARLTGSYGATQLQFHPSNRFIAGVADEDSINVWTIEGNLALALDLNSPIQSFAFSGDGKTLMIDTARGLISYSVEILEADSDDMIAEICAALRARRADNPLAGMGDRQEDHSANVVPTDEVVADQVLRVAIQSLSGAHAGEPAPFDVCG
jgi:hypothetical protein